MGLLWAVLTMLVDDEYHPLVRIWAVFSWAWMFGCAYFDSLRPDYDPAHVPTPQILWSIWPWFAGPALMYLVRFLVTGTFRAPKNQ